MAVPEIGPVAEQERLAVLDVLRGAALLGIFVVNMPFFAMPLMQCLADPALQDGPLSERLAFSAVNLLFTYKFISLFSLLFGMGFALQWHKARSRGGAFAPIYLRRLAVLFLFGLAHGVGLWYGDILLVYAIAALPLMLCAALSVKTLVTLAGAALVISMTLAVGVNSAQLLTLDAFAAEIEQDYARGQALVDQGDAPSGMEAITQAQFDPGHPVWLDAETRAYRDGPLADATAFRAVTFGYALLFAALGYGWRVLAMFLLGAAMMKTGFLGPDHRLWHRRLALVALPVGLLLEGVVVTVHWLAGHDITWAVVFMLPVHEAGSLLLMLGYVGAICLIVHGGALPRLSGAVAAAGRMALTVYISMTVLGTAVTYWWGLGWFGSLSRVTLLVLPVAIYAGLVLISVVWLRRFRFGPLEWLWRSATYLKLQPMSRTG